MTAYHIAIYEGATADPTGREAAWTATCSDAEWESYLRVRVPGFDSYCSVDLASVWRQLHSTDSLVTGEATGLETIHKFGATKQLQTRYTVVIEPVRTDS